MTLDGLALGALSAPVLGTWVTQRTSQAPISLAPALCVGAAWYDFTRHRCDDRPACGCVTLPPPECSALRLLLADLTIALAACAVATIGIAPLHIQRALATVPLGAAVLAYPRSKVASVLLGGCAVYMMACKRS